MRIGFLGLGGVGGYFAAKLSHTYTEFEGSEIVLLAREKTAAAIRENGIKLITPGDEFVAHPHVIATNAKEAGHLDYLIVAVKSYDLESSLEQFRDCISRDTIILPLLNGIDARERTQAMFPSNEVWNGCVYIVSRITAPGVITETGNIHDLHYGGPFVNKGKYDLLYYIIERAHREVFSHIDVRPIIWKKFIFISTIASLTSYLDVCIGKILDHEPNRAMLIQLLEEVTSVAIAENIPLDPDNISTTLRKFETLPFETTSSMHSDFRSGSRTELNALTGKVVELAAHHGIPVPAYTRILEGLRLREN